MINIGIDVHKIACVVTIKNGRGRTLEQTSFDNNAGGISSFIRHVKARYARKGRIRAVCESTANYWIRLHDTLEHNGIDTLLAHPAKTKVIAHAKLKDDKLDSAMLADLLRSGMIYESFVPDRHHRDLRSLVRNRLGHIHDATKHKNSIHAILAKYDHSCPVLDVFSKKGVEWLCSIRVSDIDRITMDMHLETIKMAMNHVAELESEIAGIAKEDRRARLIMTIPGINYVTAVTILAEAVDIGRYASAEKFASAGGIIPSHRSSASTYHGGGITKQGSAWMRNAIVEAATTTIRHDRRMKGIYERIRKRCGAKKAKIAVARHMLEIIWHMLTNDEEYRTQDTQMTQRKYKRMERAAMAS